MDTAAVLTTVMKGVADALRLDGSGNKPKEAYTKYLECTLRIVTKLMQDIRKEGGVVYVTKDTVKFVRLAQQCMERISAIINNLANTTSSTPKVLQLQGPNSDQKIPTGSKSAPVTPLGPAVTPDKDRIDGHARLFPSTAPPFPNFTPSYTRQKGLSPMEIAYRQNQQLMDAYKNRVANLSTGSAGFNLRLTIQRKMAENLAIAKIHEEALAKKMEERQKRLEEQASRKFSDSVGQSKEEDEKKQLYKNVLEYEQDTEWFATQRHKLEESPTDSKLMQELILGVLRCADHPLTEKLKTYQFKIYERISPLVKDKMEDIKQIKVPLPENLYPVEISSDSSDENEESDDDKSDDSATISDFEEKKSLNGDNLQTDDADVFDSDDENDPNLNNLNKELTESSKDASHDLSASNIEDCQMKIKEDLDEAIIEGDELKEKLLKEQKQSQKIVRLVSQDYEQYSMENMDDLFDDDDEEEEGDEENDHFQPPSLHSSSQDSDQPDSLISKTDNSDRADVTEQNLNESLENKTSSQDQNYDNHVSESENTKTVASDKEASTPSPSRPSDLDVVDQSESISGRRPSSTSLKCRKPVVENVQAMEDQLKEMKNEAYHRHIKGISADVQTSLEKLQTLFIVAYEQLNTPQGRDQCYACLEKPFFQPLWLYLLALFRLANEPREIAVAYVMTRGKDSLPRDYKVAKKLRLEEDSDLYPYKPAVMELQTLTQQYTLLDKLECLVKCSRLICQCVEDYYTNKETEDQSKCPSIGADDLLPILCYVIVRTGQPQIVSECHIMEEFIHEGYIMGEEGYCLTSLQTALAYLTSLGIKNT